MPDYITDNMPQLMNGPALSLHSETPDHTSPPVVEKILAMIERFLGKEEQIIGKIIKTCKNLE